MKGNGETSRGQPDTSWALLRHHSSTSANITPPLRPRPFDAMKTRVEAVCSTVESKVLLISRINVRYFPPFTRQACLAPFSLLFKSLLSPPPCPTYPTYLSVKFLGYRRRVFSKAAYHTPIDQNQTHRTKYVYGRPGLRVKNCTINRCYRS